MGERALSLFQAGIETTRGVAVASTRIIGADIKAVPEDRAWTGVKYADGTRAQFTHKRNDVLLVQDSLSFSNLYYQMIPMIGICSLDGTITPAEQTVGQADYLWSIAPSITAANDPDSLTLEMADNVQAYEIEYVQFDSLKIAGSIPQGSEAAPVTGEFGYYGRQVTATTVTAGQALHTGLTPMNAKLSRLYLDTTYAGIGGTEKTATLRGWEIEVLTGLHPKFFGDANKYFAAHGESLIEAMVTLVLEGNSTADAMWDDYQAGTERALRLRLNGPQIAAGVNYQFTFDLYGYFESVKPLNENSNGNNLHAALFRGMKDTSGNYMAMSVITNHNTI